MASNSLKLNNSHPIIFYMAHGNEALMREALSYGAFDFLAKPNFDNLESTVKSALEEGLKGGSSTDGEDEMARLFD